MFRYQDLLKEVELFEKHGVETGSIGDSTLGQATPYIFVGNKEGRCIIVQGGIHAREHITSLLVVCQAKHLLKHHELLLDGGIYFIPMTNPDGVRLAQEGAGFIRNKELKKICSKSTAVQIFALESQHQRRGFEYQFRREMGSGQAKRVFPRRRKLCRQNAKQRKGDEKSHQIYQSG